MSVGHTRRPKVAWRRLAGSLPGSRGDAAMVLGGLSWACSEGPHQALERVPRVCPSIDRQAALRNNVEAKS